MAWMSLRANSWPTCWPACIRQASPVLVLNRFDEIPEFIEYAGVLADCTLSETGEKQALLQQALVAQLAHSENLPV